MVKYLHLRSRTTLKAASIARWKASTGVVAIVSALSLVAGLQGTPAAAATITGPGLRPPVLPTDAPDPAVLNDGGTYYLYSTSASYKAIPVWTSSDGKTWNTSSPAEALPNNPSWAKPFNPFDASAIRYAPSVIKVGNTYVMWYGANESNNKACIGVATGTSPFNMTDVTPTRVENGVVVPNLCWSDNTNAQPVGAEKIDVQVYRENNNLYLLWSDRFNTPAYGSQPSSIYIAPLNATGTALVGPSTKILTARGFAWEELTLEAPSMINSGGRRRLFFSGNSWASPDGRYAIGYANCDAGVLAPCTHATDPASGGEWLKSIPGQTAGPGGQDFFVDRNGLTRMVFHNWSGQPPYGYDSASGSNRRYPQIEPVEFTYSDPIIRTNWSQAVPDNASWVPASSAPTFIQHQYADFFGQTVATTDSGLQFWVSTMYQGVFSPSDTNAIGAANIYQWTSQTQYHNTDEAINLIYRTILKRRPTIVEFRNLLSQYLNGYSSVQLATSLLATPEAQTADKYPPTLTNSDFVDRLYTIALNRVPSQSDRNYWVWQLGSGRSRPQLVNDIGLSDESRTDPQGGGTRANRLLVDLMYAVMLNREPDQGGYDYWMNQLSNSMYPRQSFIYSLQHSTEYASRGGW